MLASSWRTVTRSATIIRQLQRRFIRPSRFQLQALRPNTWLAKLLFRPDGTKRSKLIAFGFGFLILSNFLTLYLGALYVKASKRFRTTLWRIIRIQRTDTTYDSVDFGDPISTISYFKKLCQAAGKSEEVVDRTINNSMALIVDKETKDDSIKYPGVKALSIMKSTAEKIHGAYQELDDYSTTETAERTKRRRIVEILKFVIPAMDEALKSLSELDSSPK